MIKYLTVKQVADACEKNKYLLMLYPSGHRMGVNCKISKIILNKRQYSKDSETSFIGYLPCDFNTYINYKHRFVKS